ncbi:MAG: alpha/beta hydrolase, partial [Bacteroidota bacterium]
METKEIIQTGRIPKPALSNLLTEPLRVWRDLWRLRRFKQAYSIEPAGDGHPVLVIPGLLGNDTSTWDLRKFIRK